MDKGIQKVSIRFFNDREVRAIWDEEQSKWWFSVLDVVGVLNDQDNYTKNRNYWKYLKTKLKKEDNEVVSATNQLKLLAPDGKRRLTDVLDTDGILLLAGTQYRDTKEIRTIQKEEIATQKTSGTIKKNEITTQKASNTTQKKGITTQKELDTTQKKVLEYFKKKPKGTRVEAANALGDITEDGVKFVIGKLQQKGLLKRVGGRKHGEWQVDSDVDTQITTQKKTDSTKKI